MSLNLFKSYTENEQQKTLLGKNNAFRIEIAKNTFWNNNNMFWRLPNILKFEGITTDNISLDFNIPWSDAGGAVLGKKVQGFLNTKILKALATQSEGGYTPFILTDAWTQKKVKTEVENPVKVSLKFKLYHNRSAVGSPYMDVIKFLTHIVSPIKPLDVGSDAFKLLKNSAEGLVYVANDFYTGIKKVAGATTNGIVEGAKALVNQGDTIYQKTLVPALDGRNNGNFTVTLVLGNGDTDGRKHHLANHMNNIEVKGKDLDGNPKVYQGTVDWIITDFNFTPSMEFTMDNKKKPKPLWVDFTVNLESRLSLSNKYIYDLLNDTPLSVNYKSGKN